MFRDYVAFANDHGIKMCELRIIQSITVRWLTHLTLC
jgi:hypothetical protein